jgi:hypothetical protein
MFFDVLGQYTMFKGINLFRVLDDEFEYKVVLHEYLNFEQV